MNSRWKYGTLLATLVLTGPALASCSSASGAADEGTLTLHVGQLGSSKVTEALLAESGEAAGMDYDVEYSLFPTGGGGFYEAVPSGSVDVAQMADTPPIFGQVAGAEATIIGVQRTLAPTDSTVEIFAPADSEIDSAADLKGKKVALTEGTIMQYTVLRALEDEGLSYDDITAVNLPPADAVTAYQSGDVDAIAALGPQLAQLTVAGEKVIADGVGTTSGYQVTVATDAALADEATAEAIVDFTQRVGRAQAWADAHKDEWTATYASVLGVPEDQAAVLVARERYSWVPINKKVIKAQQEQADAYADLGLIDELDVAAEFDAKFNTQIVEK